LSITFVFSLVTKAALAIAAEIVGKEERLDNLFSGRASESQDQQA
jgi:hypothetical protein